MNLIDAALRRSAGVLVATAVVGLLTAAAPGWAASAPPDGPADVQPAPAQFPNQGAWREFMHHVPMPQTGCFEGTYPYPEWFEVPCTTAPAIPYPPARGPRSDTVGNGNDFSAQVSIPISEAVGSFDSVTGVKSEHGTLGGANAYTLQLNSSFFTSPACAGAADPSQCLGWQQFIYSSVEGHATFMQYWLLNYGTTCPSGFMKFQSDCFGNSSAARVPLQKIGKLANMTLTGQAAAGGADRVILSSGSKIFSASGADGVLGLADAWTVAEFNVFGDAGGSQADFNKGSTIVVRTTVTDGSAQAPSCSAQGFTGETNNLTIVDSGAAPAGSEPAIVFTETNAGGATGGTECHPLAGQ